MVTTNGTRCSRRLIASSTACSDGLWLPITEQLELRREGEKVLPHETGLHLVAAGKALILFSAHALPRSISLAAARRTPRSLAISVGWRSARPHQHLEPIVVA